MPRNKTVNKELEELKKRRRKAQDNDDISEEAKLCNVIGETYSNLGDHENALRYHCFELRLSEATSSESIDTAVAYRKVGECHCELGNYKEAIKHHRKHLEIATKLGNLVEIQRANTTLGRTYFIHGHSELDNGRSGETLFTKSESAYLTSLEVCNRLVGKLRDDEILNMRAGCYLNLGLVYENQSDFKNAYKFMEKALNIAKELGDGSLSTVLRCHLSLGSFYMKEYRPSMALRSYQSALGVAKKLKSKQHEAEVLKEITQAHFGLSNFQQAKNCLKAILKLPQSQLIPDEVELATKQLKVVRKILHYNMEVEGVSEDMVQEKMELFDKLGDLCCDVHAWSAAIEFYKKQLNVAKSHKTDVKKLSSIYVSLGRTCTDGHLYSQAIHWYNKDLELWKGNPEEECDTWTSLARVRDQAGLSSQTVLEAYINAAELAEQTNKVKLMCPQYKAIVEYCRTKDELDDVLLEWERKLSELLDSHPEVAGDTNYSSEEESQGLMDQDLSDTPPSLSSDESGEDDEEDEPARLPQTRSTTGYAVRRKSKLKKTNEKGETLLHVASIEGSLPAVKQLLREGADVNIRDHCGWLPLHEACNYGNLEVVRILLDNGASINDPGGSHCDGVTPLIDATVNGHVDVVKLLVEKGANVFLKNKQGHTALDVVQEKLADEPNEDRKAIQEFLLSKMGRAISPSNTSESHTRDRLLHTSRHVSQAQTSTASHKRSVRRDRSGASILHSSDEEDEAIVLNRSKRTRKSLNNSAVPSTSRIDDSRPLVLSKYKDTTKVSKQTSLPALVPQNDSTSLDEDDDQYPLVDNWLVDDIGEPPTKKQRSSSKEREVQSFIGGSSTRTGTSSRLKGGRSQVQKNTFCNNGNVAVSRPKSKQVTFQHENTSDSPDRDDGYEWLDDVDFETLYDVSEFDTLGNSTQPASETTFRGGSVNESFQHHSQHPPPYTTAQPIHSHPDIPLRVRVRIEDKCYLIPCPRRNRDGSNVTVGWLTDQAIERYYSQHGGRPKLKLTTMDGALLCSSDALCDVLLENEEVMGVVEDLPLYERYQMACKNAGIDHNQKVIELFRSNKNSSKLDFSKLGLTLRDSSPLFEAIQSEVTLTSLILTGNSVLRAKGMVCFSNALSKFSNLEELNISCTAMTAQGLELLAKTSPRTWKRLHTLNLSFNNLGVTCGWSLAQLLRHCLVLRTLHLDSCMLTAAIFSELSGLCDAMKNLRTLVDLSISLNKLYDEGISSLIQSLPPNLSRLNIGATCSLERSVTEALNKSTSGDFFKGGGGESLEYIDLSCCGLTDDGTQVLVSCLEHSNKLRELKLAGNSITVNGIEPLCRLVTLKSSLRILDLSGNQGLGNSGSLRLIKACTVHGKCFLNLADCGVQLPFPEGVIQSISATETGVDISATNKCYKWKVS